ncbi:isomerase YraM [Acrasis kona]|uniref:Isomerase YraM n=1 Tax=Acrasis kona TaxID=1008807 RepID=A0AAW2ZIH9_9EUKA
MGEESTRGKGGSDKPKIHHIQHNSKKDAREAAGHAGQGKPIHDSTGSKSGHYHPTDKNNEKIKHGQQGGTHYDYGPKEKNK